MLEKVFFLKSESEKICKFTVIARPLNGASMKGPNGAFSVQYFLLLFSSLDTRKGRAVLRKVWKSKRKKGLQNPESGTEPILYRGEKWNSLGNVHKGYPIFRYTYSVAYILVERCVKGQNFLVPLYNHTTVRNWKVSIFYFFNTVHPLMYIPYFLI